MGDLTLVINLGSSSLKAALVDSTGAFLWHEGRSLSTDDVLEEVLDTWLTPAIEPHRQRLDLTGHRGDDRSAVPAPQHGCSISCDRVNPASDAAGG